jgi:hypothetical protein
MEQMASIQRTLAASLIAFFVTLGLIVGLRLDQAALTMVVGVGCGIGASIPTGLLVVLFLRRRDNREQIRSRRPTHYAERQPPPVVVVSPPSVPQLTHVPQAQDWARGFAPGAPAQREFAVIGDEGLEDGFDFWQG